MKAEKEPPGSEEEIINLLSRMHIPRGVALNDIFLDSQDMCDQLNVCKLVLNNMRKNGQLSYTQFTTNGKVFYLKQEAAATLLLHVVIGKNSPLRKKGPKCISTLIGLFSMFSLDVSQLVSLLMLT